MTTRSRNAFRGQCRALVRAASIAGLLAATTTHAAPISYTFTWTASGTVHFAPRPFTERMEIIVTGDPTEVRELPGGSRYVNDSRLLGNPAQLSGFGASSTYAEPLLVGLRLTQTGPDFHLISPLIPDFTASLTSVFNTYGTSPGSSSYDLRSSFGPFEGTDTFRSRPGLNFNGLVPGVVEVTGASDHRFQAMLNGPSEIAYKFSFEAVGTVTPPPMTINERISLTFVADTDNVFRNGAGIYFNAPDSGFEGLDATLTGFGRSVDQSDRYFVSKSSASGLNMFRVQPVGLFSGDEIRVIVANRSGAVPGDDFYDLRSDFGPFGSADFLQSPTGFDFTELLPGRGTFSGVFTDLSFTARMLSVPVPEPGTISLLLGAMMLMQLMRSGSPVAGRTRHASCRIGRQHSMAAAGGGASARVALAGGRGSRLH